MRMLNMINLLICKCQYTCYASIKFLGVIKYLICMLFDSIIWLILDITMNTVHIFTKKNKNKTKNNGKYLRVKWNHDAWFYCVVND